MTFQPPSPPDSTMVLAAKGMPFEDAMRLYDEHEAKVARWNASIPACDGLIFQGRYTFYMITRDPLGGWRTTFVATDHVVSSHERYKTRLEAFKDIPHGSVRLSDLPFLPEAPQPYRMKVWDLAGRDEGHFLTK